MLWKVLKEVQPRERREKQILTMLQVVSSDVLTCWFVLFWGKEERGNLRSVGLPTYQLRFQFGTEPTPVARTPNRLDSRPEAARACPVLWARLAAVKEL